METAFKITELIIDLLKVIAWPIVVLITIYLLKESLRDLIKRIRKIGNDSVGIEASASSEQSSVSNTNPLSVLSKKSSNETIEKALGLFNQETLVYFKEFVKTETQLESITNHEERESTLFRYSQVLYLILHFNRIYSHIFGSQLDLLQALNGSPNETRESLRVFYTNAKSQNPKFFENYSYEQYLEFLRQNNLIRIDNTNKVEIMDLGKDFLKYIIETGLTMEKLN